MKSILAPLALSVLLSGCAVYEPVGYSSYPEGQPYPYPYAQNTYPAAPVYVAPPGYTTAPVYAAPVYVQPPVSFSFGFLFGGHGWHGDHDGYGGHGGHHGGWHHR